MQRTPLILRGFHPQTKAIYDITTISFVKEQIFGKDPLTNRTIVDHINSFVLLESSGVKDKWGKYIFEGDLVVNQNYHSYGIVLYRPGIFVVHYPDTDIQLNSPRNAVEQREDIEVVGNYYLNSDLLMEGGEKMEEQTQPEVAAEQTAEAPAPEMPVDQPVEAPVESQAPVSAVDQCRELMGQVLDLLRAERDAKEGLVREELADAVKLFELASMRMIRSQFADQPYDPRLKLMKAA